MPAQTQKHVEKAWRFFTKLIGGDSGQACALGSGAGAGNLRPEVKQAHTPGTPPILHVEQWWAIKVNQYPKFICATGIRSLADGYATRAKRLKHREVSVVRVEIREL